MNCLSSPVLWNSAGKDGRCVFLSHLSAHQLDSPLTRSPHRSTDTREILGPAERRPDLKDYLEHKLCKNYAGARLTSAPTY